MVSPISPRTEKQKSGFAAAHGGKALPYRTNPPFSFFGEAEPRRSLKKGADPESYRLSAVCGGKATRSCLFVPATSAQVSFCT